MTEEKMDENILEESDSEIYEVGYHILPTVGDDNLSLEASKVRDLISGLGAEFIGEGSPVMKQLSYPMVKKMESKNLNFSKAYFGWIKFEISKSQVGEIKKGLEANQNVLRFIIIKTVRENTLYTPKIPVFKKEENREEELQGTHTPTEEKLPVSEIEIDKSIDDLVTTIN